MAESMRAAVVDAFGAPPRYGSFPAPCPGEGGTAVEVLAAGLHPRVRFDALGPPYARSTILPMVPGIDGVGRTADGTRVFFSGITAPHGSLAERAVVPAGRALPLPPGLAPEEVAAAMNPAVSAWTALTGRAALRPGERVLVLGATGCAGRTAVRLARRLGAAEVVAAGRNPAALARLTESGATALVDLRQDDRALSRTLAATAGDTDVVVDYLWGPVSEIALAALASARTDPAEPVRWVHLGTMSGPSLRLEGSLLRKANIVLCGSGEGSVAPDALDQAYGDLLDQLEPGRPLVDPVVLPLGDIAGAWHLEVAAGARIVLTP
ncbi:zinc-binding alcohol dehydrogenase family protein [Streptomyces sp. NPDC094448]|uniref:quinone oxidoreductase family protein n=1 Tax=Streptomyces sp. NPDC094448 TaxID=3366063 RepID=UPI0037F26601